MVAALAAGGFFWLSQSSLLAVEEIEVTGNRTVSTEEILDRAGPWLRGQSLLKPSFGDAGNSLGEIPLIERADIERDFPHTIRIRIREHRPFVSLKAAENRVFILSVDGKALMGVDKPTTDLPVLSTKDACAAEPGFTPECPDVSAGISFLANIPVSFNQGFSETMVSAGDVTAKTRSGATVHFGSLDDYELKFEVLRQLLARTGGRGGAFIDVSVPERPVTK